MPLSRVLVISFLLFLSNSLFATTPFSAESAYVHLKVLAEEIGPRPVGSAQEHRTLQYVLSKFREYGIPRSFLLTYSSFREGSTVINTSSGIAVGIKPGKSSRSILIGAHIDSASPDVPGAIDDASGSACVLELARILASDTLTSTLIFCLFGGEEIGSLGSSYFTTVFPDIDSVALMLQIDMANGSDELLALVDGKAVNSPPWLVEESHRILRSLGYSGITYPTDFFSFNTLVGGIGSDHIPFLERGIPAICFSSSLNDPIHTRQDNVTNFTRWGLQRSGDLVYLLVKRYDNGIPPEPPQAYHLVKVGNALFFLSHWLLLLFLIGACVLSTLALYFRRTSHSSPLSHPKRLAGLRLFLLFSLVVGGAWYSESVVGFLKGVRYPWIAHSELYFLLAALAGIWIFLLLARKWPSFFAYTTPYRWFRSAFLFLAVHSLLLAILHIRLAIYPAIALACLGIIILYHNVWVQSFSWLIAFHFLFHLPFSEGFPLLARMTVLHTSLPTIISSGMQGALFLFFTYWFFPIALMLAGILSLQPSLQTILQKSTHRAVLIFFFFFIIASVAVLSFLPSYNEQWQQNISVNYKISEPDGNAILQITSPEYLSGLQVRTASLDTVVSRCTTAVEIPFENSHHSLMQDSLQWEYTTSDSSCAVGLRLWVSFIEQPERFSVTVTAGHSAILNVFSPWEVTSRDHSASAHFAYPETTLFVPCQLSLSQPDTLSITLEGRFVHIPPSIVLEKRNANIISRTIVSKQKTVVLPSVPRKTSSTR